MFEINGDWAAMLDVEFVVGGEGVGAGGDFCGGGRGVGWWLVLGLHI